MLRAQRTTLAAIAAAALVSATAGTAFAAAGGGHSALSGSVPSWATGTHKVSASSGAATVDFRVYLDWRGGDAAANLAQSVSRKGSGFLTAQQFRSQFAPSQTSVNAVSSWLKGQGFALGHVPDNRKYVEASGTVSQAAAAFGTTFSQYSVDGTVLRSNDTALTMPSSLTGVEAVLGLDESAALVHRDAAPPAAFVNARPCSAYWAEKTVTNTGTPDGTVLPTTPNLPFAPCGYAGAQLQGAYGVTGALNSGNDGSGITVGVVDAYASPTIVRDVEAYSTLHGLPAINGHFSQIVAPGTFNRPANKRQDPAGWSGEETLDIEAVHTMAPGADIVYAGSANNFQDMDAALNHLVDTHRADIITNSYGWGGEALPKGYIKPQNDIFIQAAATGISLFFSSGDSADETGGVAGATPTPDWPASSPWVTAVGGTSMGITERNSRLFELGWETGKSTLVKGSGSVSPVWATPFFLYGSGGGTSRLFTQPSYQAGVVPGLISGTGGAAMRTVPDVSALGDPNTGFLVGQTQRFPDGHDFYSEYRIGGTSLSSPLYAGMFALVQQKARHAYGLANPALYATRAASSDITKADAGTYPGVVRTDFVNGVDDTNGYVYSERLLDYESGLTIHVTDKYDTVTGIGSPNGPGWLDALVAYHQ
jgi:subtilase family serine protease